MSSLLDDDHDPATAPPVPDQHPQCPIPSYQLRETIGDITTELLVQTFDDRIMVIITQNGKVGCLTQASLPAVAPLAHPPLNSTSENLNLPPPPDSLLLTPLLGTPPKPTLYDLYSSQIATLIWWTLQEVGQVRRPVVVGLALDKKSSRVQNGDGTLDAEDGDELDDGERERFMGIMNMVIRWPGRVS